MVGLDLDLDQLATLGAAVSGGTFDAAARALHVTPSAISQRIKALETSVGRVLLTRTKPIAPTASGQTLLRAARQIQTITADAVRELGDQESPGGWVIPLAVNADSLATWFVPALAALGDAASGGPVFDLRREDQERTADLLRQGTVMAAVTALASPVAGCTVLKLGKMRYRARASAAFATRWFPHGVTAAALARAPVVDFDRDDRLQDAYLHRRGRRLGDPPRHYVPGSDAFARAVRLGLGWGMVPDLQVSSGDDLVELDPNGIDVGLYWQQWRLRSPALERLTAAVLAAAVEALI